MADSPNMKTLQSWMHAVISHPDGVAAGLGSDSAQSSLSVDSNQLESVVCRSQACTSLERLAVYNNAYFARLMDCLEVEFPALRQAVGEEAFGAFAIGYLQSYPSQSYTLNDLGRRFPAYLAKTRPPRDGDSSLPDWADFLTDLTRLERLYSEVFDGPGEERIPKLSHAELSAISPEAWPDHVLETAPSLRLIELQFPVHEYISAVRKGESLAPPGASSTWLVVNRREYVVRRRTVGRVQFELLRRLVDGEMLGDAIMAVVPLAESEVEDLAQELERWFAVWTREGFFIGIRPAPSKSFSSEA